METEELIGGCCDGLKLRKTNANLMYAGIKGDGWIRVYLRQADGKLHFSYAYTHTVSPSVSKTIEVTCSV